MTGLDWTEFSAAVVSLTALIAAIVAGARGLFGDRFRRDVEQSASLLSGYQGMVASLQADIANARKELEAERAARNRERLELYAEIDKLRDSIAAERDRLREALTVERAAWNAERQELHRQIDELRDKVATLQSRDATDRTRKNDPPRRTTTRRESP